MEKITTVGIDLAKNVFSLHAVDANGKVGLKRTVRRAELAQAVAGLAPCVIGMEACSGAHAGAHEFQALGHTVKLMAPAFVIPYRKSGKNDGNDAQAICEAVSRPSMRFVPVKSEEMTSTSGRAKQRLPSVAVHRGVRQRRVQSPVGTTPLPSIMRMTDLTGARVR